MRRNTGFVQFALFWALTAIAAQAFGQAREPLLSLAKKEKPALLEILKALVSVETGSRDSKGLDRLEGVIAGRLKEA